MTTKLTTENKEGIVSGFMQAGRMIKCGNCQPELYESCVQIQKKFPHIICECVCHSKSSLTTFEEEKLRGLDELLRKDTDLLFTGNLKLLCSAQAIRNLLLSSLRQQREMMRKEAEEIHKDLRDIIFGGHNCRGGVKEGCALFEKIAPIEKRLSDLLSNKEIV